MGAVLILMTSGNDVNYIDWKSSSRVGKTLIRRYFADRKHDVLFIGDTGKKMTGDTPSGESKEQIALMAFGVAAYLLGKQGVNYALSCCGSESSRVSSFTSGPMHLEELITEYHKALECGVPKQSFYDTVSSAAGLFERHMVMIIITDADLQCRRSFRAAHGNDHHHRRGGARRDGRDPCQAPDLL